MPNIVIRPEFEQSFKLPNPGLRTYFSRVEIGQPKVFDTPFARGESTSSLLEDWKKTLVSISDKWPSLYEFEIDLGNKVGPMSVMKPLKQRMKDIDSYYEDVRLASQPVDDLAVHTTVKEFQKAAGINLRSLRKTMENMKKSTNSGSPFFTKRKNVVDETISSVVWHDGLDVYQAMSDHKDWKAPAVLGWRGQEGGPSANDVKQRVIWMFPFAVNLSEAQLYQPLVETFQHFNLVPAWVSMQAVDNRITSLFDTKGKDDLIVCSDFSRFDQHFNEDMQIAAEQILRKLVTPCPATSDWFEETFGIKYMIPLAYDYGMIMKGKHGMASGSGGTNADETLAHRALQHEVALKHGATLNPNSQCLGDDGILSYPGITVEDVVQAYSSHGQEMNLDKQYASTQNCVYLRRWHDSSYRENGICVGVYSTLRALGRLRYLERYMDPKMWSAKAVALRQLAILENVNYHPLKEQFVDFCMKRDKYRLGLDIPGFLDSDKLSRYVKETIDYMPDFLGYTKSLGVATKDYGINNWWIVRYLKSKR